MALKTTTINPAAGPLIVTYDPPRYAPRSPPKMAEIRPAEGGAPDAREIPNDNGRAIRKTTSPALISLVFSSRVDFIITFPKLFDVVIMIE
jgi:hypothetical protein